MQDDKKQKGKKKKKKKKNSVTIEINAVLKNPLKSSVIKQHYSGCF